MELHIYKTADEVITGLADFFIQTVKACIDTKGQCTVVLSGGNSPKQLYQLLASPSYAKQVDWSKIYFFFGDERCVPFTDTANNGLMAKQTLFDLLKIEDSKIFYINTSINPVDAAADYEKKIRAHFNNQPIQFDLVLLGLGDNAHTASLFPHTAVLYEMKALVSAVFVESLQSFRITLTAPVINESKEIVFLVFGTSKAAAVKQVLKDKKNIEQYPAQLIEAEDGTVHWFLDNEAASMILDQKS